MLSDNSTLEDTLSAIDVRNENIIFISAVIV